MARRVGGCASSSPSRPMRRRPVSRPCPGSTSAPRTGMDTMAPPSRSNRGSSLSRSVPPGTPKPAVAPRRRGADPARRRRCGQQPPRPGGLQGRGRRDRADQGTPRFPAREAITETTETSLREAVAEHRPTSSTTWATAGSATGAAPSFSRMTVAGRRGSTRAALPVRSAPTRGSRRSW